MDSSEQDEDRKKVLGGRVENKGVASTNTRGVTLLRVWWRQLARLMRVSADALPPSPHPIAIGYRVNATDV